MPSLSRLLRNSRQLARTARHSNYYTSGRALMGSPEVQPVPKHVFQYHYIFDYYPEALGAFNVYSIQRDQFSLEAFFACENFEFRYEGEQWDIGSMGWHLFFLLQPLIYFVLLSIDDWNNDKARGGINTNHFNTGGFFTGEMVNLDVEPPILGEDE